MAATRPARRPVRHDNAGLVSTACIGFNSVHVSYAYPAGAAIKSINDVIILPQ